MYSKLFEDQKLPDTFSGFFVFGTDENDLLVYGKGGMKPIYMKIIIRDVVAYQSHEEFCHPDMDGIMDRPHPPFSNAEHKIYYPALSVNNSEWLASFSENRLRHRKETAVHYKFLSYSNILDVIANAAPTAVTITKEEYLEAIKPLMAEFPEQDD